MSGSTTDEDRLTAIESRLRYLEDEAAIRHLICSYGPAVDSGNSKGTAQLWTDDGIYDYRTFDDHNVPKQQDLDQQGIEDMLDGPRHQTLIAEGVAHTLGPALVKIDGDTAVATNYSVIFRRVGMAVAVYRFGANRWELARTPVGWRVTRRINRLLDGSSEARELLGKALSD